MSRAESDDRLAELIFGTKPTRPACPACSVPKQALVHLEWLAGEQLYHCSVCKKDWHPTELNQKEALI